MSQEGEEPHTNGQSQSFLQLKTTNEDGAEAWQNVSQLQNKHGSTTDISQEKQTSNEENEQHPHLKVLPMTVKHLLSPKATIKAHRKANFLYRHSKDKIDTNLLIFLHGAGDSHVPFHTLAKKMNIPQCASLSLHASCMDEGFATLPFGLGHSWFAELDYATGQPLHKNNFRLVSSLQRAVDKLDQIISELTEGGWVPERIFLFGFSAGACLAMQTCLDRTRKNKLALGGAICVAGGVRGPIKEKDSEQSDGKANSTPVLIIGGSKDEQFTPLAAKEAVDLYNTFSNTAPTPSAKSFIMEGKGHGMISSVEETHALMEFCGQHMVRRMIAMEGYCEISPDQFRT